MARDGQPTEERRFALRLALRIPLTVVGRGEDGGSWSEPTKTEDISTVGALFELNQHVELHERLRLRAQRGDGRFVMVTALVTRTSPAASGRQKVGVQIESPTEPWLRLFVSWVADTETHNDEMAGAAEAHV